jgi:hypothetical protein
MANDKRRLYFKITIVWLAIILFGCFWFSVRNTSSPIILTVMPEAPRAGEPVFATFKLNNPSARSLETRYQFFANGALLGEGLANIAPFSNQTYENVFASAPGIGTQLNFLVKTQSAEGDYERIVSIPPYPPQVWTSFISFASFSTTVMSSMSSMAYYEGGFTTMGLNIGVILAVALIALLVFLELADTRVTGKTLALGRLKVRFATISWILLIVFLALVYTRVVLILAV